MQSSVSLLKLTEANITFFFTVLLYFWVGWGRGREEGKKPAMEGSSYQKQNYILEFIMEFVWEDVFAQKWFQNEQFVLLLVLK